MAVDTLGPLLAAHITAANAQDPAQVEQLAGKVQAVTGDAVEMAFVDQGYTGDHPAREAAVHGLLLEVVKLPEAKTGFVRLPRRWEVKRRVAWTARLRRLARDYERLPATLAGFHFPIFAILMLKRCVEPMTYSA